MSSALQVTLIATCVAVIILAVVLIWILLAFYARARKIACRLDELITETQTMVGNINKLSLRSSELLEKLEDILHAVQGWTKRADRIVEEVSEFVEAPLMKLERRIAVLLQAGRMIKQALGGKDHSTAETEGQVGLAQKSPVKPGNSDKELH